MWIVTISVGSSSSIQRTRGHHGEQDDEVVLGRLGLDADLRVDELHRHVQSHPQPQRWDASDICHYKGHISGF